MVFCLLPSAPGESRGLAMFSPLPYHTANGKTVPAVTVTLREDNRRIRAQVVTMSSRTSSSRPPVAKRDAFVDETIRAIVVARTEKVEEL